MLYAPQFGQRDPDAARKWMVGYLRGIRDFNDVWVKGRGNRDEVVDTLTRHTALKDPALIQKIGWPTIDPNGAVNVDSMRDQLRWYGTRGVLQGDPDLNRALDMSYVQYAIGQLGEYR